MTLWLLIAIGQAVEAVPPSGASGTVVAIWTLALGTLVNALLVWLKYQHDARTKRDEAKAAAEKAQQQIDADAAKETRRLEAETAKELRLRQWQIEDRDRLAREVEMTGKVLAARVERVAGELATTAAASHEAVVEKINENTNISRKAFDVGNHINEKLAANSDKVATLVQMFHTERAGTQDAATVSNSRLDKLEETPAPGGVDAVVLDRVDQTTQETLQRVKDAEP